MPETIEKDGEQVEVYSKEEVDAAATAATEAAKAAGADPAALATAQAALAAAEADKVKLAADLERATKGGGGGTTEENITRMRQELLKKDEDIKKLQTDLTAGIQGIHDTIHAQAKDALVERLSMGDPKVKEKILFHYNRLADPAKTQSEIEVKVKDAYLLAVNGVVPDALRPVVSSAGARPDGQQAPKSSLSPDAERIGKAVLGITDKDIESAKKKGLI